MSHSCFELWSTTTNSLRTKLFAHLKRSPFPLAMDDHHLFTVIDFSSNMDVVSDEQTFPLALDGHPQPFAALNSSSHVDIVSHEQLRGFHPIMSVFPPDDERLSGSLPTMAVANPSILPLPTPMECDPVPTPLLDDLSDEQLQGLHPFMAVSNTCFFPPSFSSSSALTLDDVQPPNAPTDRIIVPEPLFTSFMVDSPPQNFLQQSISQPVRVRDQF
jgi:hypothetical protein